MKGDTVVLSGRPTFRSLVLIEDDAATTTSIKNLLSQTNVSVICKSNGHEGIEIAIEQGASNCLAPLVLVSMNMQGFDGFFAIRELRRRGFDKPIIALTTGENRQRCISAGCDDLLRKPIDHFALRSLVENGSS